MNIDAENAFLDDLEYGLVPEKPIYTHRVVGSNDYLNTLRGPSGEPLMWERTHTTTSPGINGIIDVYQCKYRSGQKYKVLYINMYGTKNSTTIPQGFTRAK